MIKFSEEEIKWAVAEFGRVVTDKGNIEKIDDEEYKMYLDGVDDETIKHINLVIENKSRINIDENVNEAFKEGLYWALGMIVWLEEKDSVERVREMLGNTTEEEYYSIYAKVLNAEDE